MSNTFIEIKKASANNLKEVSLAIPHHQLIVITGVSGSGKSSLAFDVLAKEGQRRYFETLPSFVRNYLGKFAKPAVESINGLSPVITVAQKTTGISIKSTVGTMSDLYSYLRLLFARCGTTTKPIKLSRSLFSFNSEYGQCPHCKGIGQEEQIDINKLIVDPSLSIREGVLAPTLPTGYIMYSQVRMEVLNTLCEAEGFNVDIPWNQLSQRHQEVILYGSNKIKVEFGKHSLASRMKWTGIKAKPPEEDYYKGMIPMMTDILRRDRNINILKYVSAKECTACKGHRLNEDALAVKLKGKSISDIVQLELEDLYAWLSNEEWDDTAQNIINIFLPQITLLKDIGLGYLSLNTAAKSLSGSESQRIKLVNQLGANLSDVLYIFDEPSIGLHATENIKIIHQLKKLVAQGNTVIVVEHDLDTIESADWIVEVGPKAGINGGEILFNGSIADFNQSNHNSPTRNAIIASKTTLQLKQKSLKYSIGLNACTAANLKSIDVQFQLAHINVVSGKSGSGTTSLINESLIPLLENKTNAVAKIQSFSGLEHINGYLYVDQKPIGRSPRSNPATYLGIADPIRDLFASLTEAKAKKYTKSRFSFNNKGGRCETCEGAGKIQIGMHILGKIDQVCGSCGGKRFNAETLSIKYNGLNIAEIYQLSVQEAIDHFSAVPKILKGLLSLQKVGLDYLSLGQSSTSLSGGEAQRIKLANELQQKQKPNTLYIFNEPSIGLHYQDLIQFINVLKALTDKGHTVICIEQDDTLIKHADWLIELGPGSGKNGGQLVYQGIPRRKEKVEIKRTSNKIEQHRSIELRGVKTHLLKNIAVQFPKNEISVVTGLSGSGKSSLVIDTLHAVSSSRFSGAMSTYVRSLIQEHNSAQIESVKGLGPTISITRKRSTYNPKSTLATSTGIYAILRVLYSRISHIDGYDYTAQQFSFNHELGACINCNGSGWLTLAQEATIIEDPSKNIFDGAFKNNKTLNYYTNLKGQFVATLQHISKINNWDLNLPWNQIPEDIKAIILYGTGEQTYELDWHFETKTKQGIESIKTVWKGFIHLVNEEFERKQFNKNIEGIKALLTPVNCPTCNGHRLKSNLLEIRFAKLNIGQICQLSIDEFSLLLDKHDLKNNLEAHIIPSLLSITSNLKDLGLGYLQLDRLASSLSGGEQQRIQIAGQLYNNLYGVTFLLDEPSLGLDHHQSSILVGMLRKLCKLGNTIIMVEHDKEMIKSADYIVEMGPKSGKEGGEIMFQGRPNQLKPKHLTYQFLYHIDDKSKPTKPKEQHAKLNIKGAKANNLKTIDLQINIGLITFITGVSGSGKTSLVYDVIYQSYLKKKAINCDDIYGLNEFDQIKLIDQRIAETKVNDTIIVYCNILSELQSLFAKTDLAKSLKLKKADFSFLSKTGKCKACNGLGKTKISLDFISDLWSKCDYCNGSRYNAAILDVKIDNHSIADFIDQTIDQLFALNLSPKINKSLKVLQDLGLGYLGLGQDLTALSGGEIQRLKLAKSIIIETNGKCLYLFDEPSAGLHFFNIKDLVKVFNQLKSEGHTILIIEHNESMLKAADHIITLGPGSGPNGGNIL